MSTTDEIRKPEFDEEKTEATESSAPSPPSGGPGGLAAASSGAREASVSRRDVIKTGWTVPVVMAVTLPRNVAAGSPEPPPPEPPPDPATASIDVTAECDGNNSVFTIINVSDDNGPNVSGTWEAYSEEGPPGSGILIDSGNFGPIAPFEGETYSFESNGTKIRFIATIDSNGKQSEDDIACPEESNPD